MDDSRVRRKDTTKGPPLRILSLDGGGVRGFSMLIILQELMHRTFVEIEGRAPKRDEIPRPCDHFDLIAGTGTGGLIAIMLGRLRLDLDTCKDVYVRMTRRVFETDKTFFGMPLRSTMFKASMLEEAIRQCVREHTVFADEGNDALANATPMTPTSRNSVGSPLPQRSQSQGSQYSQMGKNTSSRGVSWATSRLGDPDALLYDTRENRTKVAVTAVMKGTPVIALLRSYDSRKETAPDVNCTIWQAGRATSATQMAFKPIQIGQSVYLDDGAGRYNPAPQILDEAVQNEWPGREVGVFVSIGTGKRPSGAASNKHGHEWWEDVLGGSMGDFAEARRRLAAKMEGCEESHRYMLREHLARRGVNADNYYRLNVEIGLGELKMNEWYRLAEISTNTRMYLQKNEVQASCSGASTKIAKIHFAKLRYDRAEARRSAGTDGVGSIGEHHNPWEIPRFPAPHAPHPDAVELAGDDSFRPVQHFGPDGYYSQQRPSIPDQKYTVEGEGYEFQSPNSVSARPSTDNSHSARLNSNTDAASPRNSRNFQNNSQRQSQDHAYPQQQPGSSPPRETPPPVPPKTPVQGEALPYPSSGGPPAPRTFMNMGELGRQLPYPDVEGPPPAVDVAGKPKLY
ncbi:related to calcium-independent phospholipase A2 [Ramularia collo-cygni]|uniref:Related to calcium-independent phospholipase A2 n=1 Tax=Ramularia collo-cygni TaxID=112498 RepID=A0A2D3V2N4_9PEZI|nr:related to calcium-independent phospholipase A2 [Ramularia collo-cygni]CZT14533.1 related to calcium-independent phospholipase A2 [Ramularia collo-cygni]